jgi:hypothetical protein
MSTALGLCCAQCNGDGELLFTHRAAENEVIDLKEATDTTTSVIDPLTRTAAPSDTEKDAEKSKLQVAVKQFARASVSGLPCVVVDWRNGTKTRGMFFLDRTCRSFAIQPAETTENRHHVEGDQHAGALLDLLGIGHVIEEPTMLTESVRSSLSENQLKGLVYLQSTQTLSIIRPEDTKIGGDFVQCLRVLRLYAKAALQTDPQQ